MKKLLLIITLSIIPFIYGMEAPQQPQLSLSIQDLIDRNQIPKIEHGYLDLSSKGLTSLYGLQNLPNKDQITGLALHYNQIVDIPENIFDSYPHLKLLDLSFNLIVKIYPRYFEKLVNLEDLYLEGLNIFEITPKTFEPLHNLKGLYLKGNRLVTVPKDIVYPLTALAELDLSDNNIEFLDIDLLRNQAELNALSINNNKLESLPHITHLSKLRQLNLKGNRDIKELSPEEIAFIQQHHIVIDHTKLIGGVRPYSVGQLIADLGENWKQQLVVPDPDIPTYFVVNLENRGLTDLSGIPPTLFDEQTAISKVSVRNNYLKEIPTDFIIETLKIPTLYTIDLSNNRIKSLPTFVEKLVRLSPNLLLLDISHNKIKTIPPNLFDGMNIGILELHNNKIHTIDENSFNGHETTLEVLSLAENKLEVIPSNVFKNLLEIEDIELDLNRLGHKEQYIFPPHTHVKFYPQQIPMLKLVVAKQIAEGLERKSLLEVIKIMRKIPVDLHDALFKAAPESVVIKMHNALKEISLQQGLIETEKSLLKNLSQEPQAIHEKQ